MTYHLQQRFDDGQDIIAQESFKSIREAAKYAVTEGDTGFAWVTQCFTLHRDDKGFVRAAQDCTEELKAACLAEWQDRGCRYPIQLIKDVVEENYEQEEEDFTRGVQGSLQSTD